ncbi:MAG TPA: lipopolysaccharide kinase InaA family protein [Longimicrobium sp.]|jgi:hypothetical protein|uniref:lipopolysaccharide kinase InaA family protein n=1 Tax=Longimicrobium sp. TaxID=2029185 RepID=UPI002EDB332E
MAPRIYPSLQDYNIAVEHLPRFAREQRLLHCIPRRSTGGKLVAYSGGYSRVYAVDLGGRTYALRCWTADVGDARERYRHISAHFRANPLPYFVEFEYLENALVSKNECFPVLWMEWAHGLRLRDFIAQNVGNPTAMHTVAESFREMVADLHARQISHGDLQDENIIVQTAGAPGGTRLRLIDYDSVYVPSLQGYPDQIIGVSNYQHPRRNALRVASQCADYFSELVIYLSLLAYAGNPSLWDPARDKQLLFTEHDFAAPNKSAALQKLQFMSGSVVPLSKLLAAWCREPDVSRLQPLEEVLADVVASPAFPADFLVPRAAASRAGTAAPPDPFPSDFLQPPPPRSATAASGTADIITIDWNQFFAQPGLVPVQSAKPAQPVQASRPALAQWDEFFSTPPALPVARPAPSPTRLAPPSAAPPAPPPPAVTASSSSPTVVIAIVILAVLLLLAFLVLRNTDLFSGSAG